MADRIRKIISPDGLKRAKNELAYLFRLIAYEIGLHGGLWENNLRKYLDRTEHGVPKNNKDRSYARGNLNTQLMDDRMTWNVFMQGLKFMGASKIKFKVELTWPSGRTTTHSMNVRVPQPEELSIAEIELGVPPGVAKIGVPTVLMDTAEIDAAAERENVEHAQRIDAAAAKYGLKDKAPEAIAKAYPPKKALRDVQRFTTAVEELEQARVIPDDTQ
jgi:hypothetical protein